MRLRIVLVDPPSGVDFGIQQGRGRDYKTIAVQRSQSGSLQLDCSIEVKGTRVDGPPNFVGPIAQGSPAERFVYVDIGKAAGQTDCVWDRRIKIPLEEITWQLIDSVLESPHSVLQTTIAGTGRDGGPSCATVKPIDGWQVVK